MDAQRLRNYARLIARVGIRVQKGQDVLINCDVCQPDFIYILVEECYEAGARHVTVNYSQAALLLLQTKYESEETLQIVEPWREVRVKYRTERMPCRISLVSAGPEDMKDLDINKNALRKKATSVRFKHYADAIDGKFQKCIAGMPSPSWAKALFPDLSAEAAMDKLWEAIFRASRADGDPVKNWEEHNKNLNARAAYLSSLNIKALRYYAGNGTDITIGFMPKSIFVGGSKKTSEGAVYNINIPTEECFVSPDCTKADGIVYSSMPLSWNHQLIDNFWFRFENGKVVDCGAEKNEEALKQMIAMDEGASRLGECALVPKESPIRQAGMLFLSTLYDENAACHLALGNGFPFSIPEFQKYTPEQRHQMGLNTSMIHSDFMIGTDDLSVDAQTEDGKTVAIFRNGTWAFDVGEEK